jgi:hypothetical protein
MCHIVDHKHRAADAARASHALQSTGDDQGNAVLCRGSDDAPNQEYENRDKVHPSGGDVFVQLAPDGCGGAEGEEDGAAIPADIIQLVEVIRDGGDCCRDNALWCSTVVLDRNE